MVWLSYDMVTLVWLLWYGMVVGAGGMAMACRRGNHPFLLAVIIDLRAQDEISGNASPWTSPAFSLTQFTLSSLSIYNAAAAVACNSFMKVNSPFPLLIVGLDSWECAVSNITYAKNLLQNLTIFLDILWRAFECTPAPNPIPSLPCFKKIK